MLLPGGLVSPLIMEKNLSVSVHSAPVVALGQHIRSVLSHMVLMSCGMSSECDVHYTCLIKYSLI